MLSVLEKIQSDSENIVSDKPQRFSEAAADGDYYRQGDVYIIKRDELPSGCRADVRHGNQLAPGTTKGSRHTLDSMASVTVLLRLRPTPLQGPFLLLEQERVIEHPEHGDIICPPGVYEITYQRAYADDLRAVRD